jgi:GT2 family glycosyltransferase
MSFNQSIDETAAGSHSRPRIAFVIPCRLFVGDSVESADLPMATFESDLSRPLATPRVSVIIPVDRPGPDVSRCVESLLRQKTAIPLEVLLVAAQEMTERGAQVRTIVLTDRNPAVRRNLAASEARGAILAFLDDDATAAEDWIASAVAILEERPEVVALGGPDPAPDDSTRAEMISEALLSTRWIGSGVLCHERRAGTFPVTSPHDLALVNLFVRREQFEAAGGFDVSIGYIGEDSDLVTRLLSLGQVLYSSSVVVRHRRRGFPFDYLAQRWRYRMKNGRMLVAGKGGYRRRPKLIVFLLAGVSYLVVSLVWPWVGLLLLGAYFLLVSAIAIPRAPLPWRWRWLLPFAFAAHHATYFGGLVIGMIEGLLGVGESSR